MQSAAIITDLAKKSQMPATELTSVPIVFIHYGKSDQLELAIRQVRHSNPGTPIYLLGDTRNQYISNLVQHFSYETFGGADSELKNVYKHLSSNPPVYEYFCFKRWFLLLEFMNSTHLDWACTMDSDFFLYDDVSLFAASQLKCKNLEAGFCIPDQQFDQYLWACSGHISIVSLKFLKLFCRFIVETYTHRIDLLEKKVAFHKTQKLPGGICDMTLLYLYHLEHQDSLLNLLLPVENKVFDLAIGSTCNFVSKEFKEKHGFKDIRFRKNLPYGEADKTNQEIYFRGLHFQGTTKNRMHEYYTGEICSSLIREKLKAIYLKIENVINLSTESRFL